MLLRWEQEVTITLAGEHILSIIYLFIEVCPFWNASWVAIELMLSRTLNQLKASLVMMQYLTLTVK